MENSWDFDALARIVPDIDWKDAGLTDAVAYHKLLVGIQSVCHG